MIDHHQDVTPQVHRYFLEVAEQISEYPGRKVSPYTMGNTCHRWLGFDAVEMNGATPAHFSVKIHCLICKEYLQLRGEKASVNEIDGTKTDHNTNWMMQ